MQTKINQVRLALAKCDAWYAAAGKDIRLLSERTEELWFQVDDLVFALQEAEASGYTAEAERNVDALLRCALAIEAEVEFVEMRNRM